MYGLMRKMITHSASRQRQRARRMAEMIRLVKPPSGARVVDLGGMWMIWSLIEHDFHVTLVNLSPWPVPPDPTRYQVFVADACDLQDTLPDNSFDFAFSNSTIEHVGGPERRRRFAREVQRLAPAYWVQTPNPCFPIESHSGLPFYWRWPRCLQRAASRVYGHDARWREFVATTVAVEETELRSLFQGCNIYYESMCGFKKSFSAYCPYQNAEGVSSVFERQDRRSTSGRPIP
jgi:Methyltransferase domain